MNAHYSRLAYQDLEQTRARELWKLLSRAYQYIDQQSEEMVLLLSLTATLALESGYPTGLIRLDNAQDPEWRHVLVIDLPAGQVSFPVPADLLSYFRVLPPYQGRWHGWVSAYTQKTRMASPGCAVNGIPETTRIRVQR